MYLRCCYGLKSEERNSTNLSQALDIMCLEHNMYASSLVIHIKTMQGLQTSLALRPGAPAHHPMVLNPE